MPKERRFIDSWKPTITKKKIVKKNIFRNVSIGYKEYDALLVLKSEH